MPEYYTAMIIEWLNESGLDEFDSAFDFVSQDESRVSSKKWDQFPTIELRDAFLVFMIDILGKQPNVMPPFQLTGYFYYIHY